MGWEPNVKGMLWFCEEVLPLVRKYFPDIKLYKIDHNPLPQIKNLERIDKNIIATKFVDDVMPYIRDSAIFVAPLHVGSGLRLKIINAMAWGLPIVTTKVGYEGIPRFQVSI